MSIVDLRSDTVTRPTAAMREAMMLAPVGDDVFGDDPTINLLQERVALLFGKEAALYVPSGTMGNQVCLAAHTRPGDEILFEEGAHIFQWEAGGPAVLSGLLTYPITGRLGVITAQQVESRIRPDDEHYARTRLVSIENTHNHSGGTVFPLDEIRALRKLCDRHGLALHLDGARIWNAHVASGVSFATYGGLVDSISVCFSKGLGCPVGSVVAGDRDFIRVAHQARKRFGGGMRQAGMLAAACLYALDHHVLRMTQDHDNAHWLATELAKLPGAEVDLSAVQTNIVYVDVAASGKSAKDVETALYELGIWTIALGPTRLRCVTHLDVDRAGCDQAAVAFREVLA
jgi:threonine aldolase